MLTLPVRIVLADCADLLLAGARLALEQYPDYHVLTAVSDFNRLLEAVKRQPPDVIVLGEGLDPDLDMWEQINQLQNAVPHARYVLLSTGASGPLIHDAFAHGIDGVLCKSDELQTHLCCAILSVIRKRPYLSPTANVAYLITMQSDSANERLDAEARQVLHLLAHGEHAGQISERLGIDKRRVYWVREKLRRRFGAKTNEHLIQRAAAEGFIYPGD